MTKFNRRSYLKGSLVAAGGLAGIGGSATVFARSQGDNPSGAQDAGPPASDVQNRGSPAGTTQLAKYETEADGDEYVFEFVEGESVITFTEIDRSDEGEIVGFEWESERGVAVVAVQFGPTIELFEGGFEGAVDLSDEQNAIGNAEFSAPQGGRSVLCELDQEGIYTTEMHLENDPANGGRGSALHITSQGDQTTDYGHSMVNVLSRVDERISLGNLDALSFEYYEGADNERNVPGEVYVSVLTPDDDLKLAVRTVRAAGGQAWNELDVLDQLEETWSVISSGFDQLRTSELAEETAAQLRDGPDERVALANAYEDATLAGVGVGAASTRTATVIDRYYDNLTVEWDSNSASFDFPATVPVDVVDTSTQGGNFIAELELRQAEVGVDLNDTLQQSVKLNAFGAFTPPIERGVSARTVRTRAGRFEALFDDSTVDDLLEHAGVDNFIISGDFDVPNGSSFFGTGEKG